MVDHNETRRDQRNANACGEVHTIVMGFIQYLCSLTIIQQILYIYDRIKCSNENVKKTFDKVEDGFKVAYVHSLDLYNRYQQTKISDQPKHVLETLFVFGFGIAVILAQLNLTVLVALITMVFNAIASGKEAMEYANKSKSNAQAAARQIVTDLSEKVQQISRVSTEKVEEQANRILDGANRVAHMTMGVSEESDDIEKTPWNRFQDLTRRILENSMNRVDYWAKIDARSIVECLSYSISLADMVRKNKSWIVNKVGELRTSMDELKTSLEMEGKRLKKNPEEMLMCYLQQVSSILPQRLHMLEEATGKVLSEQATNKLVTLISYIEELNEKLVEAENVHELKDEVLKEAHDRLVDLLQWLTDYIGSDDSTSAKNSEPAGEEVN